MPSWKPNLKLEPYTQNAARKSKMLIFFFLFLFMTYCTFSKHLKNAQINLEFLFYFNKFSLAKLEVG